MNGESRRNTTTLPAPFLTAAIVGAGLGFLGASVVNVALPTFQVELGASASQIQWIVSAYNLAIAALLLSAGAFSDRYGHLGVFRFGLATYGIASVICAVTTTADILIAARALQGLAAAVLIPSSIGLVNTTYPAHARAHAVGLWSNFSALGGGLGPLFGGTMIALLSWRWMFWVNLPLVCFAWWQLQRGTKFVAGGTAADTVRTDSFDWQGAIYSIVALGFATVAIIGSARLGVSHPKTLGFMAVAVLFAILFLYSQSIHKTPIVPLSLFRSQNFVAANIVTFLTYSTIGGGFYIMMLHWIQIEHYSTLAAGALTLPFLMCTAGLAHPVSRLTRRIGAKLPMTAGASGLGLGFASFAAASPDVSFWIAYFPGILLSAVGITLLVAPVTMVVMGEVSLNQSGLASGINSAVARSAILLSVATLGAIHYTTFFDHAAAALAELALDPADRAFARGELINMAAAKLPANIDIASAQALRAAIEDSFVHAVRLTMLIAAGLSLLAALVAFILIEQPRHADVQQDDSVKS